MEKRIQQLRDLCGIDVGCTNIKLIAVVDDTIYKKSFPSGDDFTKAQLIDTITKFYKSFNYDFKGIGIAFSGCTIDAKKVYKTSLQCLKDLSISDFAHLNCPNIRLINDANASALAGIIEYPDSNVLLGITNGTGIGCGIAINGHLFTGSNGFAGEIYGNPTISPDGTFIKNGKICSGSKILKKLTNKYEAINKGQIIEQAVSYLGIQIVSLIHSYNPDVVYLSGGGFNYPGYLETLNEFIYKYTYPEFLSDLQIELSNFSSFSGCFGAMKYLQLK